MPGDPAAEKSNAGEPSRNAGFARLRMGEVRPTGWIAEQMRRDLCQGFAGKLDQLCSEARSDIFCTGRNRGSKENRGNASNVNWWNGETEGNWRAGYIGLAFMSRHAEAMRQADAYVARILSFQDKDGYLGVFAPVSASGASVVRTEGWMRLKKTWHAGDAIEIRVERTVRTQTAVNDEVAFFYGPLLFALPVPGTKKVERTYPLPGFEDTTWQPVKEPATLTVLPLDPASSFAPGSGPSDAATLRPFDAPRLTLRGRVADGGGNKQDVTLVPLGNAPTLRRVTFPAAKR